MVKLDPQELSKRKVWVTLTYDDGSEFSFQTTLNPEILNSLGIQLIPGCLARLDKKYYLDGLMQYKQFPYQGAAVSVYDSMHYTHKASVELSKYF